MRPIEKYLNEVKDKAGISTDKELADRLGIKHPSICLIRKGVNTPSDDLCRKMARLAGDPIEKVLLLAAESRAPESTKLAWAHLLKVAAKAGVFTLTAAFLILPLVSVAEAAPLSIGSRHELRIMDIMSNRLSIRDFVSKVTASVSTLLYSLTKIISGGPTLCMSM